MNRKIAILATCTILVSFIGGAFAAQNVPALQQVFVTNFPRNQNVTVTNPANQTVQTLSVALTLSPTGCTSPANNCWLFNTTYPVVGWRTVTISVDTSLLIVEFTTRGILSVASAPNVNPCALANPVPGSFGVYPQCTIPITGDSIWLAGNSPGHVSLFLQR